jgi:hypothetical protein
METDREGFVRQAFQPDNSVVVGVRLESLTYGVASISGTGPPSRNPTSARAR